MSANFQSHKFKVSSTFSRVPSRAPTVPEERKTRSWVISINFSIYMHKKLRSLSPAPHFQLKIFTNGKSLLFATVALLSHSNLCRSVVSARKARITSSPILKWVSPEFLRMCRWKSRNHRIKFNNISSLPTYILIPAHHQAANSEEAKNHEQFPCQLRFDSTFVASCCSSYSSIVNFATISSTLRESSLVRIFIWHQNIQLISHIFHFIPLPLSLSLCLIFPCCCCCVQYKRVKARSVSSRLEATTTVLRTLSNIC